jgi:ABC-type transporter Mla MlaB component
MKTTSKRKRSSKSGPVAEAVASVEAAPTAASPEPAPVEVVAAASANEPVVVEVDANAETVSVESVAADEAVAVSEPVAVEAAPVQATPVDSVIVLAANCSVKDAASLKTSLCAVANESAAVTLDASAVERVDTATMQLLCAFARDRNARKQSIVWRGQSQALHDAIRLLGVGPLLGVAA